MCTLFWHVQSNLSRIISFTFLSKWKKESANKTRLFLYLLRQIAPMTKKCAHYFDMSKASFLGLFLSLFCKSERNNPQNKRDYFFLFCANEIEICAQCWHVQNLFIFTKIRSFLIKILSFWIKILSFWLKSFPWGGDLLNTLNPLPPSRSRAKPCRAVPRRAEPGRAERSRAEPSRAEPSRAEPSRAEPCRAEPSRAEPSRAGLRADPIRSRSGPAGRAWFSRIFVHYRGGSILMTLYLKPLMANSHIIECIL